MLLGYAHLFEKKERESSSPNFACQDLRTFCMPMANLYVKGVHTLLEFWTSKKQTKNAKRMPKECQAKRTRKKCQRNS